MNLDPKSILAAKANWLTQFGTEANTLLLPNRMKDQFVEIYAQHLKYPDQPGSAPEVLGLAVIFTLWVPEPKIGFCL